jgi:hypothetical protein
MWCVEKGGVKGCDSSNDPLSKFFMRWTWMIPIPLDFITMEAHAYKKSNNMSPI